MWSSRRELHSSFVIRDIVRCAEHLGEVVGVCMVHRKNGFQFFMHVLFLSSSPTSTVHKFRNHRHSFPHHDTFRRIFFFDVERAANDRGCEQEPLNRLHCFLFARGTPLDENFSHAVHILEASSEQEDANQARQIHHFVFSENREVGFSEFSRRIKDAGSLMRILYVTFRGKR